MDAAWDGAGGLLTLEHHDDRLLVVGSSPAAPVWTVALGAVAAGADALSLQGVVPKYGRAKALRRHAFDGRRPLIHVVC